MAKKKKSTPKEILTTPLSVKTSATVFLAGILLVAVNLYTIDTLPAIKPAPHETLSQTDLMDVLGDSISLGVTSRQEHDQILTDEQAQYWYSVLAEKPQYRDAHIVLATIAYNKHLCKLAEQHVAQAIKLDPTITGLESLKQHIASCK